MNNNQPKKSWVVYMVLAENKALYTGITTDVERRFSEHLDSFHGRSNKGAKYFRFQKPLKVVYQETCVSRSAASSREYHIKKMSAGKKRALITENNIDN